MPSNIAARMMEFVPHLDEPQSNLVSSFAQVVKTVSTKLEPSEYLMLSEDFGFSDMPEPLRPGHGYVLFPDDTMLEWVPYWEEESKGFLLRSSHANLWKDVRRHIKATKLAARHTTRHIREKALAELMERRGWAHRHWVRDHVFELQRLSVTDPDRFAVYRWFFGAAQHWPENLDSVCSQLFEDVLGNDLLSKDENKAEEKSS